jgi:hypothetical protein
VVLQPMLADRFVWRWSSDGNFSVSSTYRAFFVGSTRMLGAKELWRTKAPPKVKMFFWLALHRRLWTVERRKRHGLQDEDGCALCDQEPETVSHLFVGCVFSRQVWCALLDRLGLISLAPQRDQNPAEWWMQRRQRLDTTSRPIFDSLLLLLAWTLWKERNSRVFGGPRATVTDVMAAAIREANDWAQAGYAPVAALSLLWSHNSNNM